jgi:hypothetical protein
LYFLRFCTAAALHHPKEGGSFGQGNRAPRVFLSYPENTLLAFERALDLARTARSSTFNSRATAFRS